MDSYSIITLVLVGMLCDRKMQATDSTPTTWKRLHACCSRETSIQKDDSAYVHAVQGGKTREPNSPVHRRVERAREQRRAD